MKNEYLTVAMVGGGGIGLSTIASATLALPFYMILR